MKICLQSAWKNFGNKGTIYTIKILKWIKAMKKKKKKDKSYDMTCHGINLYKSFRKQYTDYWISPLSLGTDLN